MTNFILKISRYYLIFQLNILVVCLFLPKMFGLVSYNFWIVGALFFMYSVVLSILLLITSIILILILLIRKENSFNSRFLVLLVLGVINFFISVIFNPYLHLEEFSDKYIEKMYVTAVNQHLICKESKQLVNIFGNPEGIKEEKILKNNQQFDVKYLRYYPPFFFWPIEKFSVIVVDNIIVSVGAKGWNQPEESLKKMREQQKSCGKVTEYFNKIN